jgi:hypothetical protein
MATELAVMKEKVTKFVGTNINVGSSTFYIFDMDELNKEKRDLLLENQLLGAYEEITEETSNGRKWSTTRVPFAILNIGEELEPEEIEYFDFQCMGVLFFDLNNGDGNTCPILICEEPYSTKLKPYKNTFEELGLI